MTLKELLLGELWAYEDLEQVSVDDAVGVLETLRTATTRLRKHPLYSLEKHRAFYQQRLLGSNEYPCGSCAYASYTMAEMINEGQLTVKQGLEYLPDEHIEEWLLEVESFAQTGCPKGTPRCLKGRDQDFQAEGWLCPETKKITEYETQLELIRDIARKRLQELGGAPWRLY